MLHIIMKNVIQIIHAFENVLMNESIEISISLQMLSSKATQIDFNAILARVYLTHPSLLYCQTRRVYLISGTALVLLCIDVASSTEATIIYITST